MIRYTKEQKEKAMKSIDEKGIAATSQELNISAATLYKWKGAVQKKSADKKTGNGTSKNSITEAKKLLKDDGSLNKKVKQLEEENRELRDTNAKLRKALAVLVE